MNQKNKSTLFNFLFVLIPISLLFSRALSTIIVILILLFSIVNLFKDKHSIKIVKNVTLEIIFFSYCAYLIIQLISLFYCDNLLEAFSILKKRIPLLAIPLIVYFNYKILNFKLITTLFKFSLFIVCVFTLINSMYSIYLNNETLVVFLKFYVRYFYVSFLPYYIHPTYFGLFLCIAIGITLDSLFKKQNKIISIILMIIFLLNIYLVSSQMCTLISIVLIVFAILWRVKSFISSRFLKISIAIVVVIFFIFKNKGKVISQEVVEYFGITNKSNIIYRVSHFFESGDITREKNWNSAYSVINDNFLFGVGLGDGVTEMQTYREVDSWIYDSKLNAHNQYLEEFVSTGFVGEFFFLLFIFSTFWYIKDKFLSTSFLLILVFIMITESILNRQIGVILFSFLISLIIFDKVMKNEIEA